MLEGQNGAHTMAHAQLPGAKPSHPSALQSLPTGTLPGSGEPPHLPLTPNSGLSNSKRLPAAQMVSLLTSFHRVFVGDELGIISPGSLLSGGF